MKVFFAIILTGVLITGSAWAGSKSRIVNLEPTSCRETLDSTVGGILLENAKEDCERYSGRECAVVSIVKNQDSSGGCFNQITVIAFDSDRLPAKDRIVGATGVKDCGSVDNHGEKYFVAMRAKKLCQSYSGGECAIVSVELGTERIPGSYYNKCPIKAIAVPTRVIE